MRILLDECVPVALKRNLASLGHECQTAREAGFSGKKNGELLTLAERRWDVLLTTDRRIEFQQQLIGRKIAVLVLRAKTNRLHFAYLARLHPSPSVNPTWSGSRSRNGLTGFRNLELVL
jgi:predicted nuclease of predicted toxin-antitoxin system